MAGELASESWKLVGYLRSLNVEMEDAQHKDCVESTEVLEERLAFLESRSASLYSHWFDLMDVLAMRSHPCSIFFLMRLRSAVLECGVLFPGSEVKGLFDLLFSLHVGFGVGVSPSKHVIDVKT